MMKGFFGKNPLLIRMLVYLMLPLALGICYGNYYLQNSLTQYSGDLNLKGLKRAVHIKRDRNGVVYIDGKTDWDVFFAMGYAHAQDRMWQLEVQRRLARGTLSELFGKDYIKSDVWMRSLNLNAAALSSWNALGERAQQSLSAYAAGINAWIESNSVLPLEFLMLGIEPAPWTETDSLAWIKVFALNLSGNMGIEARNYILSQSVDYEKLKELTGIELDSSLAHLGSHLIDAPRMEQTLIELTEAETQTQSKLKFGGMAAGSNAWVVSGSLTRTGKPILAADPHLRVQIPSYWYAANIKGQKISAAGMSLVGLPIIVFGRTETIAWAGTNLMADVQDLYFEQTKPNNPKQYLYKSEWHEFSERKEVIKVREKFPQFLREAEKPVEFTIRDSLHGPIISDVLQRYDQIVALRWTALDDGDRTYESFFKLNYARDWESFRDALRLHSAPTLNMVYSDNKNNIGYIGVGKIPLRDQGKGQFPAPGGNGTHEWTGYIPFEQLPKKFNPASGLIVSANNNILTKDYPHFIGMNWANPKRARRINYLLHKVIDAGDKLSIEAMQAIQGDREDSSQQDLINTITKYTFTNPEHTEFIDRLRNWHGSMDLNSIEATLFNVLVKHLREKLFQDQLQSHWVDEDKSTVLENVAANVSYQSMSNILSNKHNYWCDLNASERVEGCAELLEYSIAATLSEIKKIEGNDVSQWRWGNIQHTVYRHIPFSDVNVIGKFFERRIGNGGSANSINVSVAEFSFTEGFEQNFGPGFRQIIAWSENSVSHLFMNSTGQSGNPLSEYYDNMIEPFRDVTYLQMNRQAPEATMDRLTLNPQ